MAGTLSKKGNCLLESDNNILKDNSSTLSPGEIIEARSRLWRIDSIEENVLEATPIDGLAVEQQKFYTPFEKIKRGGLSPPSTSIIGNLAQQNLLIKSYKLDLLHSTAPIISLQKSRVIPEEYQLVPLIMSMDMPKVRLLIADDVGLGKTIEAGLIIKELIFRKRAKKVLVVCPANLQEQWKDALEYFFHLRPRIISTRHRRAMERELPPGTNPWEHYNLLIASIDYVKDGSTKHLVFQEKWDAVVIDEAHNCAKPHQTNKKQKIDMERYEFSKELSKSCEHLLLLTATPHNGYSDSYSSLFSFLDMGLVHGPDHEPTIIKEKAKDYVVQRRRKDVLEWIESSGGKQVPFPKRDQKEELIPLSNPQRDAIKKVESFTRYLSDVANEVDKKYVRLMTGWTVMHFHKRALSSPRALICSLQNRINKIEEKIKDNEIEDENESALRSDDAKAVVFDEVIGEKLTEEEASECLERKLFGSRKTKEKELTLLKDALLAAEKVTPARDEKLQRLKSILTKRLGIKSKLIIFTKYVDTLKYLEMAISSDNSFNDTTVVTIYGEMGESARKEKFNQFEDARKAVLIATDCISEGIDLQYMSSQLIHYELPWNPNRLEQRNGRIDRYGQKEKEVYIRLLVMEDLLDATISRVLIKKAEQIRKDYGFSPPFFGNDTTVIDLIREENLDISLKTQTSLFDFYDGGVKEAEQINPFSDKMIERIKGESFYGQTKLDLKGVQKRLEETKRLFGGSDDIKSFVISGLKLYRTEIKEHKDKELFDFIITDETLLSPDIEKEIKNVSFDPVRAARNSKLKLIDLGHPLVIQLIESIKTSAFEDEQRYGRTAYMITNDAPEVTAVYYLLVRYSVETDPISILEEIVPVGVTVYGNKILDDQSLNKLLKARPEGGYRSEKAVSDTLKEAFEKDIKTIFDGVVEKRRSDLCVERRKFKDCFEKDGSVKWVKGVDKVSLASIDLLAVTLYFPPPGGV